MSDKSDKYVFTLDACDKQYAEDVLNETDEGREKALEEIKKWLVEEQSNLHARLDDKYILAFLRGCKFRIDKTKVKLMNFYTMRRDRPEWFKNRNPLLPEIQELIKLGVFVPLKLAFENKLVVIVRVAAHNPKKHKLDDVCKAGQMILNVAAMANERIQIYGVVAIFDVSGLGFSHVWQLTPGFIKHVVHAWQNDYCRLRQLEFINAPLYVNVLLNIMKSFMSEKLKARVRVHFNGLDSFYEVVDRNILPPEYGGTGDSMKDLIDYWNKKIIGHQDWFADDEQYKAE